MVWQLAAGAGIQALGGLIGSRGAKKAARRREEAFGQAMATTGRAFDDAQGFIDPRIEQEQMAMDRVNALLGLSGEAPDFDQFRQTPGFQFQMDQGQQAIERSAAARGGLASGNTLTALTEFGQGLAGTTFQNHLANIMGLQNQGADVMGANLATQRGSAMSDLQLGRGGARASGVEGQTNALVGGLRGGANLLGRWGMERLSG